MRTWARGAGPVVLAVASLSGCAYSGRDLYLPPAVPAFSQVDVAASEVVLVDPQEDLEVDSAAMLRELVAQKLVEGGQARGDAATAGPARFSATVRIVERTEGPHWVPFVGFATLVGATTFHSEVTVAITIETAEGRVSGTATAKDGGSLYASDLERAVVLATQEALTSALEVAKMEGLR